jgi:hypothetical protein
MGNKGPTQADVLAAIKEVASSLGRPPSRAEFVSRSGITEYHVLKHFSAWNEAVRAAGLEPDETNVRVDDAALLADWATLVRKHRRIPTRHQYRREGRYSPGVFDRHFGPWSTIPAAFRRFALEQPEWADVLALLPVPDPPVPDVEHLSESSIPVPMPSRAKLEGRPTYGDPIDFRGLRHAPVNEDGVVFLFGMVARELGYLVESVQAGFPDCEAKRQLGPNQWQRVRIKFEFESRNFRDHGHRPEGCDIIVCWRHNWPEVPKHLEVIELSTVIRQLAASDA